MAREITYEIAPDLLQIISKNMFTYPAQAIDELVINGYDADAQLFTIDYDPVEDKLVMTDDGTGMTPDGVDTFFTAGGSTRRGNHTEGNRAKIGKFGMAKIALPTIAEYLELETVTDEGFCTTAKVDLTTLLSRKKKIQLEEETVDAGFHGTRLTFRNLRESFKSGFKSEHYRTQVSWRLPIDDAFALEFNGKYAPLRRPPGETAAKKWEIDYEFQGQKVGKKCHLTGAMYVLNNPSAFNGFHIYVDRRRALNLEHGKFPYLNLNREGLGTYLQIMVDADFLEPQIIFNRENFEDNPDVLKVMQHIRERTKEARTYQEKGDWPRRKQIVASKNNGAKDKIQLNGTSSANADTATTSIEPPKPEIITIIKESPLEKLALEIKKNPYKSLLEVFLRAELPEVPNETTIIPVDSALASPIHATRPGTFFYSINDLSLSAGMNPLEQHGRRVAAMVYAIARLRTRDQKNDGLDLAMQQIWSSLDMYGGKALKKKSKINLVNPDILYTLTDLAKMLGQKEGTIRYMLPALIGQKFDDTITQRVKGADYIALAKETNGFLPLYEVMRDVSPEGTAKYVNASHSILNKMNVSPFLINASKLNPKGHTYFVDESCVVTLRTPFNRYRSRIGQEYTRDIPIDMDLAQTIEQELSLQFSRHFTQDELAKQGTVAPNHIAAVIEKASQEKSPLHTNAKFRKTDNSSVKEYQFKDYVIAIQQARA